MKKALYSKITCGAVLVFGLAAGQAIAQYHDDDAWHRTREEFYSGNDWRMHMFDRVKQDLSHIQDVAFGRRDEDRIVDTEQKVSDLQNRMMSGAYDEPELDAVIDSLSRVVADNRLDSRDRDMLSDDLSRVRDYRAHHENWR